MSGKFLKIHPDSNRMEREELKELERVIRMMVSSNGIMDRISVAAVVQLVTPESWMTSSHKGYRRIVQ